MDPGTASVLIVAIGCLTILALRLVPLLEGWLYPCDDEDDSCPCCCHIEPIFSGEAPFVPPRQP